MMENTASRSLDHNLTREELSKLSEFRKLMGGHVLKPGHDDYFLLRWLRARKFDLKAAEDMLRKHLNWRKSIGADQILDQELPEVARKYGCGGLIGHDKEGCPVWITPMGDLDMKGLIQSLRKRDILRYLTYALETIEADMRIQTQKLGKPIQKFIHLQDYNNFSFSTIVNKSVLELIKDSATLYEMNYPERLKKVIIINAPSFYKYILAIISQFVCEATMNKIVVLDKDDATWKSALLKEIDASELPVKWGGTKVDEYGDPACASIVWPGGKIPTSYYMTPGECELSTPNPRSEIVDKRSSFPVEVVVKQSGSVIHYEFMTEDHDIGFGVDLREHQKSTVTDRKNRRNRSNSSEEDGTMTIIPAHRIDSHLAPERGTVLCEVPGIYILKFDNSYSWYRQKKLLYHVSVTDPVKK